jgi:hypothetical protein
MTPTSKDAMNAQKHQDPRDHIGLVWLNAERMGRVFETEAGEFAGASYLAMVEAVRTWDHTKGHRFSTHAMPAMKFRAYKTVMYEKGKRRRDTITAGKRERTWVDPLATKTLQANVPARTSPEPDTDARRMLDEVLDIAAEVSPRYGAEAIRMMVAGKRDGDIVAALGMGNRTLWWLREQIKKRLAGVA